MIQRKRSNINIKMSFEKVDSNLDDLEGFKTSVEKVTVHSVEIAREVEPDNMVESLQSLVIKF